MVIKIFLLGVSLFIATLILHGGVQWLHPYVLMQAVVELRSMFTVRDVPLENIRDKRIFITSDATRIGLSMFGRVCESSSERAVPRLQTLGTRTETALLPVG